VRAGAATGFAAAALAAAALAAPPRSEAGGDWTEWRVRSVRCLGLGRTDSTVILRELELTPGTGYSDELLDADANAIKNTNLFARLVVSVRPDSLDEAVDVVYAVTERPPWLVYPIVSPTADLEPVYGVGVMHRNLGGEGRRLDFEAEFGAHVNYSLTWVEPWFLGRRQPLSVRAARRISDSADGDYRSATRSLGVGWTRYVERELSVGLSPWWQEVRIRDNRPEPEQVTVNPRGRDVYAGLSLSAGLNLTDVHVNPTRGWRTDGGLSAFGFGGSNQPAGWTADAAVAGFRRAGAGVLAAQLAAGLTAGRTGDYMKRYLGGSQHVRAGESGAWQGWSTLVANLEWRLPLVDRRVYWRRVDLALGGVLFADAGLVWHEVYGDRPLAAGGAGAGLRLFAPFVEVARLDFAWSPEHGLQVRVGRGQMF